MAKCSSVTAKGDPCSRNAKDGGLCALHLRSRENHGPHAYARLQLTYKHKRELEDYELGYLDELSTIQLMPDDERADRVAELSREHGNQKSKIQRRHARDLADLRVQQDEIIEVIGFDPDAEANARKEREEDARRARRFIRLQDRMRGHVYWQVLEVGQAVGGEHQINDVIPVELGDEPVIRKLRDIAADPQSVHTSEVVTNVNKIITIVRAIPVPDGYKWDRVVCSKTPGEIIAECRLTQHAACQMMAQYAQDNSIYDIEVGIYGKVLDSVWQFIKTHAEKDSLVSILRTELEDNIGMCAQGNLTRVCNILAGYLDGIGPLESLAERLGRLLPPLAEIEDLDERRKRALEVLTANNVTRDQLDAWIDAVMA